MRRIVLCLALAGLGANALAQSWIIDSPEPTPASTPATTPGSMNYDLRGIFDPGFNGILAAALKVPQGWRLAQSFTREWRGTIPINKVYTGLASPDGHDSIEFLPCMMYHYEDGVTARQLRQFSEQRGMHDPTSLPPMSPTEYLKKVYLPLLTSQGKFNAQITESRDLPPQQNALHAQVTFGFVKGTLASGAKFHLDAQITTMGNRVINDMVYSMEIHPRLIQSSTNLEATVDLAKRVDQSTVFNPAWQQQDRELTQRGSEQAQRAIMDQWRINRDVAEARRQAINHNYAVRRRASDQVVNAYCDYLGDRVLYQNPDTGERVKVQSGGRHAYQDRGGDVLTTDAPLDPGNVDWRELREVELKNY